MNYNIPSAKEILLNLQKDADIIVGAVLIKYVYEVTMRNGPLVPDSYLTNDLIETAAVTAGAVIASDIIYGGSSMILKK